MNKKPLPENLEDMLDNVIVQILYPSLYPERTCSVEQFRRILYSLKTEYNTRKYESIANQLYGGKKSKYAK